MHHYPILQTGTIADITDGPLNTNFLLAQVNLTSVQ